jgi:rSAM/selenodomain-associated transferase 1
MADALLVFAKVPRPGQVKTRLAAVLGDELAARLYGELVSRTLEATRSARYARFVFVAPPATAREMRAWLPDEACLLQHGGDLGARMAHAFGVAFARGARRVAVAGSDVPGLDAGRVQQALDALEEDDLAIAPAGDGGYSLLALREPHPELFADVEWSTPWVMEQTLERSRRLRVRLLDELPDLDTPQDLREPWGALEKGLPAELAGGISAALRSRA